MTEIRQTPEGSAAAGIIIPLAVVAVLAVAAVVASPATPGRGRAVAFAAGVCSLGCAAAWAVGRVRTASPAGRVTAPLAATSLRLAPALVALGWLQTGGRPLADAGAGEFLVGFYLAALAAEVIRMIIARRAGARRRGDTHPN
jgi:hypothetical protein